MIDAWVNTHKNEDGSEDYDVQVSLTARSSALFTCGTGEKARQAANKLLAAIEEYAEDADLN
jgi:hypothetical protein